MSRACRGRSRPPVARSPAGRRSGSSPRSAPGEALTAIAVVVQVAVMVRPVSHRSSRIDSPGCGHGATCMMAAAGLGGLQPERTPTQRERALTEAAVLVRARVDHCARAWQKRRGSQPWLVRDLSTTRRSSASRRGPEVGEAHADAGLAVEARRRPGRRGRRAAAPAPVPGCDGPARRVRLSAQVLEADRRQRRPVQQAGSPLASIAPASQRAWMTVRSIQPRNAAAP